MNPDQPPKTEAYVASVDKKAEPVKLNRAQKRELAKDLRRATVRATMPDMASDYRAKRKAKRRRADATRRKQR
jgi:hypothetical protein